MSRSDVVIIGSGPGGAAAAFSLSRTGLNVTLLEAGPRYRPEQDYRLDQADWEVRRFPHKRSTRRRHTHAGLQALDTRWDSLRSWSRAQGRLIKGTHRAFSQYSHVMGVGGSTLHYAGESHRMHPRAMRLHTDFGVGADWPIRYEDLEQYYSQAERIIGVAGPEADAVRPRSGPFPMPAHAMSYGSQRLGDGCKRLGMSWLPNPVASASRPYDGRPPCNYCGQCARGCPRFDRGTPDLTFIPKALAAGHCRLQTQCEVLRLEAGPNDRVSAAIFVDKQGAQHRVSADFFVLACGAVETPRLLLNSASRHAPDGLANESGLVGKNFMETLFFTSSALHPEAMGSYRGLPSDAICWDYNAPDAIEGVIGGARFSPATLEADLSGPLNYAQRIVGGWGEKHHEQMLGMFGHVLSVGAIGENLPNPRSYIDLDPEEKDTHGLAKARIHSHLPDMELKRLEFMAGRCRSILKASGAEEPVEEYGSYDMFNSTHVFGTCKMGASPGDSVVDAQCRSHRWRNLLITDASVFPSSGGGEAPSLTIYANALRVCDRLAADLGKQRRVPA